MADLSGVSVFVQVAELRSFVAAGRVLGVSASAVGKSIGRLEERLGVRLFHRSTRSIRLTHEGTLYLERCRKILFELKTAEAELSGARRMPRGRMRISLPLASGLLLPMFADFMRSYSDVELDLDFTNRYVDLIEEGFDLAIRVGELHDSRLMARKIAVFRLILVASPEYLDKKGAPRTPQGLSDHDCLHLRFVRSGRIAPWPISKTNDEPDIRLPARLISNENLMLIHAAKSALGIACVPDFTVTDLLKSGQLIRVLENEVQRDIGWWAVWPASPHVPPKLSVLLDFLTERFLSMRKGGISLLGTSRLP
ncbi:LysR family transcriptional regulator [Bradyrhizobium sp. WYCCWR 13022]|uniref:LysR family transcriptional regulator n=1 Tax=unclassified Bradyrhizobium TaxID=2631580 RepID=UPI00263A77B7|nr:LysR family transcriptional regulator [Bradyrhizobium sp. WYCCWR 13022]MDN4984313.1 LysR family transcriptional regulator [Bradyrhizobium sp. WYCCWR 13022]